MTIKGQNFLKKNKIDIKIVSDDFSVEFRLYGRNSKNKLIKIGFIKVGLDTVYNKTYGFTHSYLMKKYRGLGLGIYLYSLAAEYAFKNKIKLCSSDAPSNDAIRVWESKSLRRKYRIKKIKIPGEIYSEDKSVTVYTIEYK